MRKTRLALFLSGFMALVVPPSLAQTTTTDTQAGSGTTSNGLRGSTIPRTQTLGNSASGIDRNITIPRTQTVGNDPEATTDSGDSNDTQTDPKAKTETEKEPELTKEQKNNAELDAILLGSWVYLAPANSTNISNDTALAAAQRCIASGTGNRANRQANSAQPPVGDLAFFRTAGGIQAFDGKAGKLAFYPTLLRVDRGRTTIWGLQNGSTTRQIRFKEIGSRLGKMTMMQDKDGIYMRCQNIIDATKR